MKSTLTLAVVSLISGMSLASAQQESIEAAPANVLRRHHLTIAANPQMGYTNQTVDTIIAKMNKILQRSDFAWDVACPNVEFVRNGNVISNANIPLRATYEQFVQALRDNVPSANVVVGSLITSCGGVLAAGCAPVPGEPMAVIHDGPRSAVVWVHERGHSSGLDHVAQGKDASTAREDEWGQIMFWNPSLKSLGALTAGCAAYRNSRLSSVISAPMPARPQPEMHHQILRLRPPLFLLD